MKKEKIVKFDLERLKGKKVVVNCKIAEQFKNFVAWVNHLKDSTFKSNCWFVYGENSCIRITTDLEWEWSDKSFYEEELYEIISYEEALLKNSKKQKKSKKSKPNKLNNFKKYGFKPITKKLEGKIYEGVVCPRDKSTYYMGRVTNRYSDVPMAVEWDEMGVCSFQDDGVYDLVKID